jgi:uncharacterized protein
VKVVIAGGSGLVGRYLVAGLHAEDHEAVVLSRDPRAARRRLPVGTTIVRWHPAAIDRSWAGQLANATAVVNLCGASVGAWPWTSRTKRLLRESRLEPTNALVDAIASLPPPDRPGAFVSSSGTDLYDGRDSEPATEDTPIVRSFLGQLCLDWEAAALAAEDLAVRVVTLRTSLVVASGAPSLQRMALPIRLLLGGPIGSGEQWVSWIAIDDAVGLIVRAIRSWDICGPLNLAAPQPRRQLEFAQILGRVLGRPTWLRTPAWAVRLALGEQSTLLLGSRRVWPAKALAASYEFVQPDLESALRSAMA